MAEALGIITGIMFLFLLFKPFFGDFDHFQECIGYCLKPDILSWFNGEYHKDRTSELKVGLWMMLSGGAGFVVFTIVKEVFK